MFHTRYVRREGHPAMGTVCHDFLTRHRAFGQAKLPTLLPGGVTHLLSCFVTLVPINKSINQPKTLPYYDRTRGRAVTTSAHGSRPSKKVNYLIFIHSDIDFVEEGH